MSATDASTGRLAPAQRALLLGAARRAMEAAVLGHEPITWETADPALSEARGAFVTLTIDGELRGCMGFPDPSHPLLEAVGRAAVRAALDDRRFDPVGPEELPRIRVEVSALSTRTPLRSPGEIRIGVDGLYAEAGEIRGLLLPQVAAEQGWDAATFLDRLFRKSGLPPMELGSPGLRVSRFAAEVFAEAEPGGADAAAGAHQTLLTREVRRPAVAGLFYPAGRSALRDAVAGLLEGCADPPPEGAPVALVSPHAGYVYSGATAAAGFAAIAGCVFDAAVVVSPSHREYFDGVSVYPGRAYATPVGEMPVDDDLRAAIADDGPLRISDAGHGPEHAVEVQLPFLHALFGAIPIVPVVMGDQRAEYCDLLARRLATAASAAGRKILLVASTDLSHHHPLEEARRIDDRFVGLLSSFDHRGLLRGLREGTLEACGGGPAVAVLAAAESLGAARVVVRSVSTSADAGGDRSSVVGYVSAVAVAP